MLTQKQKDNRAYYAKHAEQIKEKKREAYRKANGNKPNETSLADKLVPEKPKVSKPKTLKSKPKSLIKPEDQKKREVRRRIEDYLLAKELGIAFSSLKNTDDN